MENNEFKKVCIRNRTRYYFDHIINLEDFDLDNILIDKRSHKNFLIYHISYKTLMNVFGPQKLFVSDSIK